MDACTLFEETDVESARGRKVLNPENEQVGNLGFCSYYDPDTPVISVATLCLFAGRESRYYARAEAQARVFEILIRPPGDIPG